MRNLNIGKNLSQGEENPMKNKSFYDNVPDYQKEKAASIKLPPPVGEPPISPWLWLGAAAFAYMLFTSKEK